MPETYIKRANMIDGIPSSFDVTYVTKAGKKCPLCKKKIKKDEISRNVIAYIDEFEFTHKSCLSKNEVFYEHMRPNDLSSPAKLLIHKKIKKIQENKTLEQGGEVTDETQKS